MNELRRVARRTMAHRAVGAAGGVVPGSIAGVLQRVRYSINKLRPFGFPGLLKIKEEEFRRDFRSVYVHFNNVLVDYLRSPTTASEKAVRDELHIGQEFLGFKYWKILADERLAAIFQNDIVWNKVDDVILANNQSEQRES